MRIDDLQGKNVCIVGFGKEGKAAKNALEKLCRITILDRNDGEEYLKNVHQFDVIVKSPGVPPCKELDAVQDKVTSGTALFLEEARHSPHTVIGVTGSKGKSTTTALIHHILETTGKHSILLGNIGIPALDHLQDLQNTKHTYFVMELSSYQLMNIGCSPHIAVITSFFPEHLDYHGSLENYTEAKKNIARFQREEDITFYADEPEETKKIAEISKGQKIEYGVCIPQRSQDATPLRGQHNLRNISGAIHVAQHLGIEDAAILHAIPTFKPLPHRLEDLGVHHGIRWINDSISTTPQSTIAAIDAFDGNISTLILGGQDRGLDFTELMKCIADSNIHTVICLPDSGHRIAKDIEKTGVHVVIVASLEEAMKKITGSSCLLSPASPSYNQFKNFEERGEAFRKYLLSPALSK